MAEVIFNKLEKVYSNGFKAVHAIDLSISEGEFMVIVGPSGCAKSTTLRMLAGLETISGGEVRIGNKIVNNLAPKERGIAMVFQNYALYPHMTVRENLAFGLKLSKLPKDQIESQVNEAAKILELEELLDRLPRQLSGGQAQRVAVGRAIVKKPDVFLFDEPLSNLDAKLRASMRIRISDLHKQLKASGKPATTVYVTHDQTEAMTMGDRICVMKLGHIMQVDTPDNLYHKPKNMFVAGFIGAPEMNIRKSLLVEKAGKLHIAIGNETMPLNAEKQEKVSAYAGQEVFYGVRPEFVSAIVASKLTDGLDVDNAIRLFENGVQPKIMSGIRALGFGPYAAEDVIRLAHNGVDVATFEALKAVAGTSAPVEHAIQFRQNGVGMSTVREAERQGFKNLTFEQFLKLHRAGVI